MTVIEVQGRELLFLGQPIAWIDAGDRPSLEDDLRRYLQRTELALRFYADPGNWRDREGVDIGVEEQMRPGTSAVDEDGGRMARKALDPAFRVPTSSSSGFWR